MNESSTLSYVNSKSNSEYHLASIEYMRNRGSEVENAHTLVGHIAQAFQGGATEQQVLLSLRCLKIREGINHPLGTLQGLIDRRPELTQGWPDGFAEKMKAHFNSDGDRVHVQRPTAQGLFVEATAPMRYGSSIRGSDKLDPLLAQFKLAVLSWRTGASREQLLGFDPSAYESN